MKRGKRLAPLAAAFAAACIPRPTYHMAPVPVEREGAVVSAQVVVQLKSGRELYLKDVTLTHDSLFGVGRFDDQVHAVAKTDVATVSAWTMDTSASILAVVVGVAASVALVGL